jgi:hypothetical protein
MGRLGPVADENPGHPYVVVGIKRDGTEDVIGWTDHEDGGKLLKGVNAWPKYERGEVRPAQPREPE